MQWWELVVYGESVSDLALASLNCGFFARYASQARSQARRVGAAALAIVNGGLALEAGLFVVFASEGQPPAAAMAVRSALFASAACVSLLVWRNGRRRF